MIGPKYGTPPAFAQILSPLQLLAKSGDFVKNKFVINLFIHLNKGPSINVNICMSVQTIHILSPTPPE